MTISLESFSGVMTEVRLTPRRLAMARLLKPFLRSYRPTSLTSMATVHPLFLA